MTLYSFDGREFNDSNSLGLYLKNNFRKSITFLNDNSLYQLLQTEFPKIYEQIIELSKDYQYKENIITLIIYLLDNNLGIVSQSNVFTSTYDIASVMKKTYPNINDEIKCLLQDKVLTHIFWLEYLRTNDVRFKRNYTFMLKINENIMYDFTYYYFLYIHLSKNEVVRFTLDGVKMKSLSEITIYLSNNIERANLIIDEILKNPFIVALMAVGSGIDQISLMLSSKNTFEILKVLSMYADVNLSMVIQQRMSYWLLLNYENYSFDTPEAKALLAEYQAIAMGMNLNNLNDYVSIYDDVNALYERFTKLFNNNRLVEFRKGITATDDYYLGYKLNGELVCKKFLLENGLYSDLLSTDVHQECVEREVIVDALEDEKIAIIEFREEVSSLTKELYFDDKFLRRRLFISYMYFILLVVSLLGGLLLGIDKLDSTKYLIDLGNFGLLGASIILVIISIVIYSKRLSNSLLLSVALDSSMVSINEIEQEKAGVLNNEDLKIPSLMNASYYRKNRKNDLVKIKKFADKKTTVSNILLIMIGVLAILPIFEFGLKALLVSLNVIPYEFLVYGINVISVAVMALQLISLVIFRKRHFVYYLIYVYLIALAVMSFVL